MTNNANIEMSINVSYHAKKEKYKPLITSTYQGF